MGKYLALLRGVNVGGNAMVKMADLQAALTKAGFTEVQTYIQSGNVIFTSNAKDTAKLARDVEQVIEKTFKLNVDVVVLAAKDWQAIVKAAPKTWGKDTTMKHNLMVLLPPTNATEVVEAIGKLKPDIEAVAAGKGVVYQSLSLTLFGRTTSGRIASNPIYKRMTIRTYNTVQKLAALLDAAG